LDTNPYMFPADMPVPTDDGACDHLPGMRIPSVSLRSTKGGFLNLAEASQRPSVFFFYPETGSPGDPIPKSWNDIPGLAVVLHNPVRFATIIEISRN